MQVDTLLEDRVGTEYSFLRYLTCHRSRSANPAPREGPAASWSELWTLELRTGQLDCLQVPGPRRPWNTTSRTIVALSSLRSISRVTIAREYTVAQQSLTGPAECSIVFTVFCTIIGRRNRVKPRRIQSSSPPGAGLIDTWLPETLWQHRIIERRPFLSVTTTLCTKSKHSVLAHHVS